MPHRYFTRELADGRAALTGSDAHHLADVMRARIGEEVVLCGPDGLEYLGTVTAIEPGRVEFSVTDGTTSKAEPDCAVTLFAGYPKAGKLEEVIRHSVELGVTEVVPFFSRYCVATPKKEDVKNERYNRIAAEAAKQAGCHRDRQRGRLLRRGGRGREGRRRCDRRVRPPDFALRDRAVSRVDLCHAADR